MGWIEDQSKHTQDWPSRFTWARLVQILSDGDSTEERNRATLYLRRLFKYALEELQIRIMDLDNTETTWDSPACEILLHYPWEWNILEGRVDYSDVNPLGTRRELVPLTLLTAGNAFLKKGDDVVGIPSMAVRSALDSLPEAQREKWVNGLSYGEWARYGDENGSVRIQGFGEYAEFTAILQMMISPRLIDWESQESYFRVRVALPWEGLPSPTTWPPQRQRALWEAVSRFMKQLVDEASGHIQQPKNISVGSRGRTCGFSVLAGSGRDRFAGKASVRCIDRTCWSGIPRFAIGITGPVLGLDEDESGPPWDAPLRIRAAMYYPNDELRYRSFFHKTRIQILSSAWAEARQTLGRDDELPLAIEEIAIILEGPPLSELQEEAAALHEGGFIAGVMLRTILSCVKHHPEYASLNHASRVVSQMIAEGPSPNLSESKVRERWGRFKSVAHLWAAMICFEDVLTTENIRDFLGVAHAFREEGESVFVPRSHRGPVLDPSETWRVYSGSSVPVIELSPPPLPRRSLRLLKGVKRGA